MKVSKPVLIPFETIISQINLEEVAEAIRKTEDGERVISDFDFEDAKRLVWLAGEKWLPRDLNEFTLEGTEVEGFLDVDNIRGRFHGFGDITGTIKGTIPPFVEFFGKKYCIDWKTSKNTLDTVWRERLIASWQWPFYAVLFDASLVIYRGISRNGELKEIILKVPESNREEVTNQVEMISRQIKELETFSVWPRNKPYACSAYGRDCEFKESCHDYEMPRVKLIEPSLSYSFIDKFMLCNEKARRIKIADERVGTEETDFGSACHRGLSCLWELGYKVYGVTTT